MSDGSKIQWTDATWPTLAGCSNASPGCARCYAIRQLARAEALTSLRALLDGPAPPAPGAKPEEPKPAKNASTKKGGR